MGTRKGGLGKALNKKTANRDLQGRGLFVSRKDEGAAGNHEKSEKYVKGGGGESRD